MCVGTIFRTCSYVGASGGGSGSCFRRNTSIKKGIKIEMKTTMCRNNNTAWLLSADEFILQHQTYVVFFFLYENFTWIHFQSTIKLKLCVCVEWDVLLPHPANGTRRLGLFFPPPPSFANSGATMHRIRSRATSGYSKFRTNFPGFLRHRGVFKSWSRSGVEVCCGWCHIFTSSRDHSEQGGG